MKKEAKSYKENFEKSDIYKAGLTIDAVVTKVNDTDINCLQDLYNVLVANVKGEKMNIYLEGSSEAITVKPYSASILKASANLVSLFTFIKYISPVIVKKLIRIFELL